MKKVIKKNKRGFTLVEVMIALGLFTVIMVIGIGAILGVNTTNRKTQSMRAVIDNLSFVMEDMARSMRLGGYFFCGDSGAVNFNDINNGGTNDGPTNGSDYCQSIAFEPYWQWQPSNPDNQVVYYIYDDPNDNFGGAIWKKDFDNTSFDSADMVALTPAEVDIDETRSGFIVVGSSPADNFEPRVTIVLVGTVRVGNAETEFNLQTTVSQRYLDIPN